MIKVINLKKHYKDVKAVDGIDLEVKKGSIVAILGPNGAGKTTTIETLEGLRNPDSGEIYYFGEKIKHINDDIREKIGVQLQSSTFFDNLSVKEIIDSFGSLYKKRIPTKELLDKFNLNEKKKAKIKELSGGQKQRVAIATAIVNDPEIVFLDEPTTGLDPQARRNLWDIINTLKSEGKTIILTTHYMEEAEKLADYVYIVDHGKIISNGTVDQLIDSIDMKSVINFNTIHKIDLKIPDLDNLVFSDGKYEVETNDIEKSLIKILDYTKENNIKIENMTIRKPNLEDVFLHLTGRSLRD